VPTSTITYPPTLRPDGPNQTLTDKMGSLAFVPSDRYLPLQFADFIAYEAYKQLEGLLRNPGWRTRATLKILIENKYDLQMSYFGREQLELLVRDYDQKGRPESGAEPWWPWFPGS
jgi:hypothetical protein